MSHAHPQNRIGEDQPTQKLRPRVDEGCCHYSLKLPIVHHTVFKNQDLKHNRKSLSIKMEKKEILLFLLQNIFFSQRQSGKE